MANYATFEEALNAGTTNMTVLRTGRNDDETYTYDINFPAWRFLFNNQEIVRIGANGNLWICLNTVNAKIMFDGNNDGASYGEYKETGTIQNIRFVKFRWSGFSNYSSTADAYRTEFEVFLFEGQVITIHGITFPTSNASGSYTCLGADYSIIKTTPTNCVSLTCSDATGSTWNVTEGYPTLKPLQGECTFNATFISHSNDMVCWKETLPANTEIKVYYKKELTDDYIEIPNGGLMSGLVNNTQYTIYFKIVLSAAGIASASPKLSNFCIIDSNSRKIIYLTLTDSVTTPLTNPIDVSYNIDGNLEGYGGKVPTYTGQIPVT